MQVGFYVLQGDGTPVFSPTFPRQGLAALFSLLVQQICGGITLAILIEHKNSEDANFVIAGTFAAITTKGVKSLDVLDLKEEVRFSFQVSGGDPSDGVLLVPQPIGWRPYSA